MWEGICRFKFNPFNICDRPFLLDRVGKVYFLCWKCSISRNFVEFSATCNVNMFCYGSRVRHFCIFLYIVGGDGGSGGGGSKDLY